MHSQSIRRHRVFVWLLTRETQQVHGFFRLSSRLHWTSPRILDVRRGSNASYFAYDECRSGVCGLPGRPARAGAAGAATWRAVPLRNRRIRLVQADEQFRPTAAPGPAPVCRSRSTPTSASNSRSPPGSLHEPTGATGSLGEFPKGRRAGAVRDTSGRATSSDGGAASDCIGMPDGHCARRRAPASPGPRPMESSSGRRGRMGRSAQPPTGFSSPRASARRSSMSWSKTSRAFESLCSSL